MNIAVIVKILDRYRGFRGPTG